MERWKKVSRVSLIAAVAGSVIWVNAGVLTPPAGPVAPTMKPLTDLEPRIAVNETNTPPDSNAKFVISQPGAYYLTGNITGAPFKSGIKITASDVSLDLNGFTMLGGGEGITGIMFTGSPQNIHIRNGTIRGWSNSGILLSAVPYVRVEEIRSLDNANHGIALDVGAQVSNCLAGSNGSIGINVGHRSTVSSCIADGNEGDGIVAGMDCVIRHCTANANSVGIRANTGSRIIDCIATSNASTGILSTNGRGSITGCTARLNLIGIQAGRGVISGNSVSENLTDGISVNLRALVIDNVSEANGTQGTGAGIRAQLNGNLIEGNVLVSNDVAIDLDTGSNCAVRNFASANAAGITASPGNITGTQVTTEPLLNSAANANVNMMP